MTAAVVEWHLRAEAANLCDLASLRSANGIVSVKTKPNFMSADGEGIATSEQLVIDTERRRVTLGGAPLSTPEVPGHSMCTDAGYLAQLLRLGDDLYMILFTGHHVVKGVLGATEAVPLLVNALVRASDDMTRVEKSVAALQATCAALQISLDRARADMLEMRDEAAAASMRLTLEARTREHLDPRSDDGVTQAMMDEDARVRASLPPFAIAEEKETKDEDAHAAEMWMDYELSVQSGDDDSDDSDEGA